MRVLVLGATGGTGRAAVHYALVAGHHVTAFARRPEALDMRDARLETVRGDVMDAPAVARAVAGQDGVIVALGISSNPIMVKLGRSNTPINVCSVGTRNALAALKGNGRRRLVCVSAYGVGETRDRMPRAARFIYRTLLKEHMDDKEVQERLVRESDTDWVIVQPVGLTNGSPKRTYLASTIGETRSYTVTRADVAAFCVEQLTRDDYLRTSVAISG